VTEYEDLLRIANTLENLDKRILSPNGTATITVNGAPAFVTISLTIAIAICTLCCGFAAGSVSGIYKQQIENEADMRRLQDYVNTLYRQIPELRKLDDREKEQSHGNRDP
jgi:hypothetical protein